MRRSTPSQSQRRAACLLARTPGPENTVLTPLPVQGMTALVIEPITEPERFVPPAPTETGYRRDREHRLLAGPKFLAPVHVAQSRSELYLG